MRLKCLHLMLLSFLFLPACIEDYIPDEEELKEGTLVVQAHLTGIPGEQTITLSRSSTIQYPEFQPFAGCHVLVERSDGTERVFREGSAGQYSGLLDGDFLQRGETYRLRILAPGGGNYQSDYECLQAACGIDQVYFEVEDRPTREAGVYDSGIQFYIDFNIEKQEGRYLRWQLIETYEIHNPENEAWVFGKDKHMRLMEDSTVWYRCWISQEVPQFFTMDIGTVDGEVYRRLPLNYVSTDSRRLQIRYSLLVRQLSMSPDAFRYLHELGKNIQEQGGLFDAQPALTPGNICNPEDEDELVIGYFSISGCSEQRIFVEDPPGLEIVPDPLFCAPGEFPKFLGFMNVRYLPVYLAKGWVYGDYVFGEIRKSCLDCREYRGSTHIKPDFW